MSHDFGTLAEHLDVVGNLLVEQATVGDHDDRVEQRRIQGFGSHRIHRIRAGLDELVGQPSERIGFSRPS